MRQHVCSFIMRWTIYILQIYFYLEILILHSFSVLQFLRIYFLGSILNYPVLIISLTHPTCSYTKSPWINPTPILYTIVSLTHRDHISLKNFYLNNKYLKKKVNYNIWCTFSAFNCFEFLGRAPILSFEKHQANISDHDSMPMPFTVSF